MNSWDKSDSDYSTIISDNGTIIPDFIGKNDLDLMRRLYKAGTDHRKYLRMITVTMDITAPLYWWKEYDTYKVGTVANSCSTMHKIADRPFTSLDFSIEHMNLETDHFMIELIKVLNENRNKYLETKDKHYWWQMIQLLPSSYNQRRTVQFNYENAVTMIKQRAGHKLDEWNDFVEILKKLPYIKELMQE